MKKGELIQILWKPLPRQKESSLYLSGNFVLPQLVTVLIVLFVYRINLFICNWSSKLTFGNIVNSYNDLSQGQK